MKRVWKNCKHLQSTIFGFGIAIAGFVLLKTNLIDANTFYLLATLGGGLVVGIGPKNKEEEE